MKILLASALLGFLAFICWANPAIAGSDKAAAPDCMNTTVSQTIEIQGTVVHMDLEGGFFVIKGDDGKVYDPVNLADSLKKEGVRVRLTARTRPDMGSTHMVGDIIEIIDITAE